LSVAAGVFVYLYLRKPFAGAADVALGKHLPSILKRLFPCGLIFAALLGFLSVSYKGCSRTTYSEIVENRSYLIEKNQAQLSSILLFILIAVLFWDTVALLILWKAQRVRNGSSTLPPRRRIN
jgi:hypothetical protein